MDKPVNRTRTERKSVNEDNRFAEYQSNTPATKDEATIGIARCEVLNVEIVPELRKLKKYEDVDEYLLTHLVAQHEFERLGSNDYRDVIGSKHDLVTLRYQLQRMKPVFSSILVEFEVGHGITRQQRRVMSKYNAVLYSLLLNIVKDIDYTKAFQAVPSMTIDKCTQFNPEVTALWESLTGDSFRLMVPWNVFYKGFAPKLLTVPSPTDEKALKRLIDINSTDHVSYKSFDNFLRAFGPLPNTLANVSALFSQRWFHGFLSPFEGEKLLINEPVGTYLVRISQSRTDSFALQYVREKEKVDTVGITCVAPKVVAIEVATDKGQRQKKEFASIQELLDEFKSILKNPFKTKLLTQPWFHGSMSLADAKSLLQTRGVPGTFLFHFIPSQNILQTYSCSFNNAQGQVVQIVLEKIADGFRVQNDPEFISTSFPNLTTFIKAHSEILKYPYDDERVPKLICDYDEDEEEEELEPWTWETVGPKEKENTPTQGQLPVGVPNPLIYASTRSNYPAGTGGDNVYCDVFRVSVTNNRCVIALSDGCNWGWRPRKAAEAATRAVLDNMNTVDNVPPEDSWIIKSKLLESFKFAQKSIIDQRNDTFEPGTTTLLSGMLTKVKPQALKTNEYAFVIACVGDCKAFHWNPITEVFTDVTMGNRGNTRDASDCGGRLGPQLKGDLPDLRNLMTCWFPCNEGDIILVMSDGIHDNLDPESIGEAPKDLGIPDLLKYATWDDCPSQEIEKLKSNFMCQKMSSVCNGLSEKSPKAFVEALMKHATGITTKTREFMENNPQSSEPSCHKEYPGKMDHATCVAIKVGPFLPPGVVRVKRKKSSKSKKVAAPLIDQALLKKDPWQAIHDAFILPLPALAVRRYHPELSTFIKSDKTSVDTQLIMFSPKKPVVGLGEYRALASSTNSIAKGIGQPQVYNPYSTTKPGSIISETPPKPKNAAPSTGDIEAMRRRDREKDRTFLNNTPRQLNRRASEPTFFEDLFVAAALTFPTSTIMSSQSSLLPNRAAKQDRTGGHFYRLEKSATRTTCALCTALDETHQAASLTAAKRLAETLENLICTETKTAANMCLSAIKNAQYALDEKKKSGALGLTALVLNWLSDLQNGLAPSKWVLSLVNVGHNKVFHWVSAKKLIFDLTPNNMVPSNEEAFQIGFSTPAPRLAQFTKVASLLIEDEADIIIICSPQVYHNFDPEHLGRLPKDFFDQYHVWKGLKKWDKIAYNDPVRQKIRMTAIHELLSAHTSLGPRNVVQILSQTVQNASNRLREKGTPDKRPSVFETLTKTGDTLNSPTPSNPINVGTCIAIRVGETQVIQHQGPTESVDALINISQDNSLPIHSNSGPARGPNDLKMDIRGTVFVPLMKK